MAQKMLPHTCQQQAGLQQSLACPGHAGSLRSRSCQRSHCRHRLHAQNTDDQLAERLRKAEAEAKELRERLAASGAQVPMQATVLCMQECCTPLLAY